MKPQRNACSHCGYLDWTVEKYGRVTHKEGCPMRTDPWHQGDPHPENTTNACGSSCTFVYHSVVPPTHCPKCGRCIGCGGGGVTPLSPWTHPYPGLYPWPDYRPPMATWRQPTYTVSCNTTTGH